ncbi:hypothetical protein E2P81_ATG01476 [Venturia nashicola]|nr:hypothetical protein E2P81_ATG01476 [Venturia nashicola]
MPPTRTEQLFAERNSATAESSADRAMPPPSTPNAQPVRKYVLRNRPLWDVEREFDPEHLEEEDRAAFEAF